MIPVPTQKIAKLVVKMRHYDIHPTFLPDVDYLYGESHPLYPLIEEVVSELCEYLLAATDDELNSTYEALDSFWHEQIDLTLLFHRDPQTVQNMATYLIVTLTHQSYYDVKRYIKADYREESEVLKIYPELANYEDDEGLIPLGTPGFVPAGVGGGIYYKDHLIYYHQYLRRYFTSSPNMPFLNALFEYHKAHRDQRVAVAIDHLRLMPKELFRQLIERSRSFGPPLAMQSIDDPSAVGLTVYTPEPRFISLHGIERSEFHWSFSDGLKTFEVEAVYSLDHLPDTSEELILARYVHSIRDIKAHAFIHLDGAVKIYRRNQYEQRHAARMPNEVRAWKKIKVFRIDADVEKGQAITDNEWSRLIGLFFQENPLVAEYLNPNFVNEG
jgi:hypothetical protein